ncbi:MAG: hypothetical protein APR54_00810 [Candidatus Cloacimonas sp. SDB]|nr:MAG: hypothetical protein APR54_00810 [Candidatus Cloacimonas sp. SDB]
MNCDNKQRNLENCNCTYSCDKKGVCCECILYHRRMNQLPACYFPVDSEKTYDRSIAYFVKLYQEGRI